MKEHEPCDIIASRTRNGIDQETKRTGRTRRRQALSFSFSRYALPWRHAYSLCLVYHPGLIGRVRCGRCDEDAGRCPKMAFKKQATNTHPPQHRQRQLYPHLTRDLCGVPNREAAGQGLEGSWTPLGYTRLQSCVYTPLLAKT